MVWRAPRIWIDGPHITAAQMNQVSENLRQTAPAKAVAEGDLFYALGRNEIARLVLGPAGRFLVPGQTAPQWGLVPTPITSLGDMVVGNSSGEPSRVSAENGTRVGIMKNGAFSWEEEVFLERWWEHESWWKKNANYDVTLSGNLGGNNIWARDVVLSGDIVCKSNPTIIRCRTLTLSSDISIRSREERIVSLGSILGFSAYGFLGQSDVYPNDGGNALAGDGNLYCGGGGAYGSGNGDDGTATISISSIERVLFGDLALQGGKGDGRNRPRNASGTRVSGYDAPGGGTIVIAAKNIVRNGHSLTLNARGHGGYRAYFDNEDHGDGGGGGGLVVCVVQDGIDGISANVIGGGGGSGIDIGGNRGTTGGNGGAGSSYIGTAFPS